MSDQAVETKRRELYRRVDQLLADVEVALERNTPIHQVEKQTLSSLLEIGRDCLRLLVQRRGDGDVGETCLSSEGEVLKRSERTRVRPYLSIFGRLNVERYVYAPREGQKAEFCEVDARLALPENKFSYLLQDWDQDFAMDQPFAQASRTVEKILGLKQHVDSLERMNRDMACWTDAFRSAQTPPPPEEEGEILVQTADGKGVPIRRPADAARIQDHERRPGPKPDRKKIAVLGAVYSVDRFVRDPEDVVESLFRDPEEPRPPSPKRPRPVHKRMRAMLNHVGEDGEAINGCGVVFGWMGDETSSRRQADQPLVNIMDGEKRLWEMRDVHQPDVKMTDVLDLLHVTPRLWEAAKLFHAAGSQAAKEFVRDRVRRILGGGASGVVKGLRRMSTTHELRGEKRRKLARICGYFENNRERMRYDEYLRAGYPIASGVIEGACRHVVKDRLERTGMNWVVEGAQPMLELRCLYLTDCWEGYQSFRVEQETRRLYPYRETLCSSTGLLAA